jgi:uncharacterized protein with von Willebrand factor type A (vWA) domain
LNEWLGFLDGLAKGLAWDLTGLYQLGRTILVHDESDYDAYDLAFGATFEGLEAPEGLAEKLEEWLSRAIEAGRQGAEIQESPNELWEELLQRLREQNEQHDGGSHWVGTGGTSPFGHGGSAPGGLVVGGPGGGARTGVATAIARRWADYRTDRALDVRDLEVALRLLRNLAREGRWELDLDATIDETSRQGGEIEIVERRERQNKVRLVLLMDAGGSMAPHAERVSKLFSAAHRVKIFRSFEPWYFHNCVYSWLYKSYEDFERVPTASVLQTLTRAHRIVFVGDASMAPWELFSGGYGRGAHQHSGLDWLQSCRRRCPSSIWLNPDPERYWRHPTVKAIGDIFPMYPLTVAGLRDGVRTLSKAI